MRSSFSGPTSKGPAPRRRSPGRSGRCRARSSTSLSWCGAAGRGDLAAFDAEPVARAIASLGVPLWTGIGHTGDRSVADIVANRSFVTPTACGQELVRQVREWWESVARSGARIGRCAADALQRSALRDTAARHRLTSATRNQLSRHAERLEGRAEQITAQARRQLDYARASVERRAGLVGPRALGAVDRQQQRAATWRRLLSAYDIERQLERGYTITLGADGAVLRSVSDLRTGATLLTRFADGRASSTVEATEPRSTSEGKT